MDKNYKQKVKDFFRKEGFYIVLFVCLCIVATVATIAFKRINENKKTANVDENNKEISMNVQNNDKEADKSVSTNEMQNAERAENTQKPKVDNKQQSKESKQVSTNNEIKFMKPVEGTLLRGFTDNKPVQINENEFRTIKGIDVEAKIGTEVKAVADGIVESVGEGDSQEGMTVVIKHTNGIKSKCCNLDKEALVKKGDKVSVGTVIGKVGNSVKIFGEDYFEEYLNIQLFNANNEQVNPLKYFSYETKK